MEKCHNQIADILGTNNIEQLESVQLVESFRQYWKPVNARIILLAESHVFTSDAD